MTNKGRSMKRGTGLNLSATGLMLALLATTTALAQTEPAIPARTTSYVLAQNDPAAVTTPVEANATVTSTGATTPRVIRDPWFSADKLHEYLGIGTLVLVAATTMTAPEGCEGSNCSSTSSQTSGTHQDLGRATRAMALSAVATGLLFHWDDMHLFEDGLKDPDTQHWLLGGTGALILANAVSKAPGHGHAGQAELGALMMLAAVKLTW